MLQCNRCSASERFMGDIIFMSEIIEGILKRSGRSDLDAQSQAKIIRYLETLKSAGKRDKQQLTILESVRDHDVF
jgi:hypothetical protein